jgi:hypothetical protein
LGHPSPSGGTQSRQATATVFRFPKGDWVVLLAALAVGGFGVYQVYKAFAPRLHRHVNEREVTDEAGGWLIVVSRIGIAARGVVFMAIALLLFHAAREHDPERAGGIADALNEVARLRQWPFVATAAGLIAYGVYQLLRRALSTNTGPLNRLRSRAPSRLPRRRSLFPLIVRELLNVRSIGAHDEDLAVGLRRVGVHRFVLESHPRRREQDVRRRPVTTPCVRRCRGCA